MVDAKKSCGRVSIAARTILGLVALFATLFGHVAGAETVVLVASHDATLIESDDGELANGAGPLFAGRNNAPSNSRRRALLAFDVAAALPPGAWVTGVALELEVEPSNPGLIDLALHRVLTAWSEGASVAFGGGGAPAEPGDATWLHTLYPNQFWATPGGDFDSLASAVTSVGDVGLYVWAAPGLIADVQAWLDDPASNFGWILVGGEDSRQNAKVFASRESEVGASRPRLVVEFETSCDAFDLGPGALGLCRAYCEALGCAGPRAHGSDRACDRLARNFARLTGGMTLPCAPIERGGE